VKLRTRRAPGWAAALVAAAALATTACGGHASRTVEIRNALDAGQPKQALQLLNEELEVDSAKQLPKNVGGDNTLLLLDRSMVLMQLDQYELSSRDLMTADKQIEVLDLSRNATAELGRYLFSDDTGAYKAPAYEKLMINTMNMVSFLARGDLNGARVEARRLAVMQRFIKEHQDPARALLGPGSYLAGFTFEHSGRPQEALRYYDEALQYGRYASLDEPIRRLAAQASYRSPRIRKLLGDRDPLPPVGGSAASRAPPLAPPPESEASVEEPAEAKPEPPPQPEEGEILVIVGFGRAPAKYAKRVPIGLALTYASGALSPTDHQKANYLAAQGLVTWVNYPELGKPRGQYDVPGFALNGKWQQIEGVLAVDREARKAWDEAKGAVIASAITRMLTRVVAGEAIRRGSGGSTLGALLSLGAQATLTATDTPDTRCWTTLPARLAFGRVRVRPGTHWVDLEARGIRKRQQVVVKPGGFAVVNLTVLH
jgi:uncharacterized protein